MQTTSCWLTRNGLSLSPEKCSMVCFTRHRIPSSNSIPCDNFEIAVHNSVKYLGMILDQKLLWSKHINSVISKCERGLNLLRYTSRKWWGADPEVCLMFYRAYIRSILDLGRTFYGPASRCHLVKMDRIQYKALRQSCGAMRSTPCLPLLAECSEPPLNIRREFLAKKIILKIKVANSEYIIDPIYNIALADP
ncbi:hypothetical protein QE152_g9809 [Popillia japonica]|uniref:Reverse transcriptase n=1 Tax=Popillia japonica TaxID=7064 RepID=A0AAW1LX75_POPJA